MLSENHHFPLPGFKLSLLTKIHEIKSNKPRMTMMHVLVESIEKNKPELLQFYKKFDDITEVAKWVLTLEFLIFLDWESFAVNSETHDLHHLFLISVFN